MKNLAYADVLLRSVLRFRRGIGEYNLSHLSGLERLNANDDNWYELEAKIEKYLIERNIRIEDENPNR